MNTKLNKADQAVILRALKDVYYGARTSTCSDREKINSYLARLSEGTIKELNELNQLTLDN
jgi:hypothetical protein